MKRTAVGSLRKMSLFYLGPDFENVECIAFVTANILKKQWNGFVKSKRGIMLRKADGNKRQPSKFSRSQQRSRIVAKPHCRLIKRSYPC